jgi:hypothetical protein
MKHAGTKFRGSRGASTRTERAAPENGEGRADKAQERDEAGLRELHRAPILPQSSIAKTARA